MDYPPVKRISDAELVVMQAVWDGGFLTAQQIMELVQGHEWSEGTVKTLISRLVKKGVLGTQQDGKRFVYHALMPREEYTLQASASFANKLLKGLTVPLFARFISETPMSQEEIEGLRKILEEKEKGDVRHHD